MGTAPFRFLPLEVYSCRSREREVCHFMFITGFTFQSPEGLLVILEKRDSISVLLAERGMRSLLLNTQIGPTSCAF